MGGMIQKSVPSILFLMEIIEGCESNPLVNMRRGGGLYHSPAMGAMLLCALITLAACGGGESLTYDESMDLLASAMERTYAGAFSLEDTNVSVVETENSQGEYINTVFVSHYVPERGVFGYQEDFNPYAPPKKLNFLTTDDGRHFEYVELERCYSDEPYLRVVDGGGPGSVVLPPIVHQTDKFINGSRFVEEGATKEVIEFEGFGGGNLTFMIEGGFLVGQIVYAQGDNFGRLVGEGFDGRILAERYVRRFYDIGVEKEFPVPEPICE